jgi:hypothetical protein
MRRWMLALLAVASVLALALAPAAQAKKTKTFSETKTVNAAIPPDAAAGASTPLNSTITVPKKYKKNVVGDVNVTGIQTTGTAAGAAGDLAAYLTAPNGRTQWLFGGMGGQNLGPWTLDDDTSVAVCNSPIPNCSFPNATLTQPFAGTSNTLLNFGGVLPLGHLSSFNGIKMRGTWTFSIVDIANATNNTLNAWGLRIKPAKPVSE